MANAIAIGPISEGGEADLARRDATKIESFKINVHDRGCWFDVSTNVKGVGATNLRLGDCVGRGEVVLGPSNTNYTMACGDDCKMVRRVCLGLGFFGYGCADINLGRIAPYDCGEGQTCYKASGTNMPQDLDFEYL
ncbi:MAG: hypothetical protein M1840_002170 [Geoglossum simile]|nr:MAG: hypothetical protein M1840_002170 [Geoglossum simile]